MLSGYLDCPNVQGWVVRKGRGSMETEREVMETEREVMEAEMEGGGRDCPVPLSYRNHTYHTVQASSQVILIILKNIYIPDAELERSTRIPCCCHHTYYQITKAKANSASDCR